MGNWEFDLIRDSAVFSDESYRIFGVSKDIIDGTFKSFYRLIHPDDKRLVRAAMNKIRRSGNFSNIHYRIVRPDGGVRHIQASGECERDDSTGVYRMFGTLQDVTERKLSEQILFRREKQLAILAEAGRTLNESMDEHQIKRKLVECACKMVESEAGAVGIYRHGELVFTEYLKRGEFMPINLSFPSGFGVPGHVLSTRKHYVSNNAKADEYVIPAIQKQLGFKKLVDTPILGSRGKLLGCFEIHDRLDGCDFDELDIQMLQNLSGVVSGALRNARLLHERRTAENSLRASEHRLNAILSNTSNISVQGYDENRNVTFWNEASRKIYGFTPEEAMGRPLEDLIIPQAMREGVVVSINNWLEKGESIPNGELVLLKKDGTPAHVYSSHVMTEDKNGNREMFCVDIDISDRKQAEKELRHERDLAHLYLNTASVMMLVINKDKSVGLANRKACEVLGYSEDEVIGKNWFERFIPEDQQEEVTAAFEMLLAGKIEPVKFYENPIRTKSGDERLIAWHNAVLRDEAGKIVSILSSGEDVTDRKQAEDALVRSEERFALAMKGANDGLWDWNLLTNEISYSGRWKSMLGYSEEELEDCYETWERLVHPDDIASAKECIEQYLTGKTSAFETEFRMRHKDGHWIDVLSRGNGVYNGQTKTYERLVGTHVDISERKKAQISLKNASELTSTIIAELKVGTAIYNESGQCTLVNDAMASQVGASKEDMLAQNFNNLESWKASGLLKKAHKALEYGRSEHLKVDVVSSFGKRVILDCHFVPFQSSGVKRLLLTTYDISELRSYEQAMVEYENRLRMLSSSVEQAGESIIITDLKGTIEYVNPSFTRMTGYTAEEVLGENPRILKSGNQSAEYYEELWETISSGKIWHSSIMDRRKDGSQYPAIMSISPIVNDKGEITHYVGIQQDMTDHEELERQFQQAQKMEAIGTLVGGIAHDFNNMLAGMIGNLYLAKKKLKQQPEVLQKLTSVEEISFRAADMIKQLLAFARKDQISMKSIPLTSFIKETIKFLHASVPENISVQQDVCGESLQIKGDATQLHQVLMNLMNNARDALEGTKNPCISIRLAPFHADEMFIKNHSNFKLGNYAHLSIEDNGSGIQAHQIDHLFEPFFTTKEEGKGTGLGLAMVFGAVKTHRGVVDVESVEGKGATFHVYIPLFESTRSVLDSPKQQLVIQGRGETILLVDDQQQITDTGKEVLESLGYHVLIAADGQQALNLFEAHLDEIDLIIIDVVMPVMGGIEAAGLIRRRKPQVKIMMSTGYDKNTQFNLEDEVILRKPFAISEMSQLIRNVLDEI
ncbi:two-component system, cell cycle sensor histidine kinase and response regulator CckA [Mariprofundus micogutta]|uniref:histidine kinase n=1 Tax=Mariprofundus micogutta TaxID=1921010 RepID=A0A1L8CRK7_9PROT|nr:PAS domain S-box protein [Mariprofundus micogutta]GAV21459.1 two-component system, cell cycle sensor histidine kinase and response regulator CckA [Mariprofundus micogutta]